MWSQICSSSKHSIGNWWNMQTKVSQADSHNIRYPLYWPLKWDFWAIGQSSRERDSKLSSMGIRVGGYWVRRVDTLGDIESSWPTWLIVQSTRLELKMPRARIAIRNALWRFYTRKWRPRQRISAFHRLPFLLFQLFKLRIETIIGNWQSIFACEGQKRTRKLPPLYQSDARGSVTGLLLVWTISRQVQ